MEEAWEQCYIMLLHTSRNHICCQQGHCPATDYWWRGTFALSVASQVYWPWWLTVHACHDHGQTYHWQQADCWQRWTLIGSLPLKVNVQFIYLFIYFIYLLFFFIQECTWRLWAAILRDLQLGWQKKGDLQSLLRFQIELFMSFMSTGKHILRSRNFGYVYSMNVK